jgi:hypothetical protein
MPQPQERPETFGPEVFRLLAQEVLKLGLDDEQVEALRQVVNGLNVEMAPLADADLAGVEPEVMFGLDPEGWPR